jgi:hypothetical protein
MSQGRNQAVLLKAVGFLLVVFLATPALAVPVRLPSGEKVEISTEQMGMLKKQPGIYVIKHPPAGALNHLTLIELPKELGGGFLVGTRRYRKGYFDRSRYCGCYSSCQGQKWRYFVG